MDRRTFMKEIGKIAGISATGISLSKLQIASVATGLSGLLGCSRENIEDASNLAPGAIIEGACELDFDCSTNPGGGNNFSCSSLFTCTVTYLCAATMKFMCNNTYNCSGAFTCAGVHVCDPTAFSCPTGYTHTQGGT